MTTLIRHARITGEDRELLSKQIAEDYESGQSIREIAERLDRSYGSIHRLLTEAGAEIRPRGGARLGNQSARAVKRRKLTAEETRAYRERLAEVRPGRKR